MEQAKQRGPASGEFVDLLATTLDLRTVQGGQVTAEERAKLHALGASIERVRQEFERDYVALEAALLSSHSSLDQNLKSLQRFAPLELPLLVAIIERNFHGREDDDIAWDAVRLLGELGSRATPAVPVLGRALACPRLEMVAVNVIQLIGPAAAPLTSQLLDAVKESSSGRSDIHVESCADALAVCGSFSPADLSTIRSLLAIDNPFVHGCVAKFLPRVGELGSSAVPFLRECLGHSSPGIQSGALRALAFLNAHAQELRDLVTPHLGAYDREIAIHALVAMGKEGIADVARYVSSAVTNEARNLSRLIMQAEISEGALVENLESSDVEIRSGTAQILARAPRKSQKLTEALLARLADSDSGVQGWAAAALPKIAPNFAEIVPHYDQLIGHPTYWVRHSAVCAVAEGGVAGATLLARALSDNDSVIAAQARRGLVSIGEEGAVHLAQGLDNQDEYQRLMNIDGIRQLSLKHPPRSVVVKLQSALEDKNPQVRIDAVKLLAGYGREVQEQVPAMTQLLSDPNAVVRKEAALALGAMGQYAEAALNLLLKAAAFDSSKEVALAAGASADTIRAGVQADPSPMSVMRGRVYQTIRAIRN